MIMLNKLQKKFNNFEKALQLSLLNVLNSTKLIELGNYTNKRKRIISEANCMIIYQSMKTRRLMKFHSSLLIKS
jgi:hypothetical protein